MEKNVSPKVSVIIPVYKVHKYLFQCISSVVNQTLKDIEILLIDEGEEDTCYAIMRYFAAKDSRVHIVHEKNGGYGASCNRGIKLARGEYISIVESDDFIEKTMLEDMYREGKKTDSDIVKTPFYFFKDGNNSSPSEKFECDFIKRFNATIPNKPITCLDYPGFLGIHPSIWSAIYKKNFLKDNGIVFIEAKGAGYVDNPFRIETMLSAKKILWLGVSYYNYRITNTEASSHEGLYDIGAMQARWKEVFSLFDTKYSGTWNRTVGELVKEFYLCIYRPCTLNSITKQQQRKFEELLDRFTPEEIKSSPRLLPSEKKELLSTYYVDESKVGDSQINFYDIFPKIVKRLLKFTHFEITINQRGIYIHLLKEIRKKIFSQDFSLLRKFHIALIIGSK